ncbi:MULTISPECIES: MarR family winged helix-turn-helix transcriptional regulator [Flavobacteriaceae]|uniref:MarR family winged helix-turn-helix transcriptional regulator n=1 Tax=Flavobacteriaceae TaxID=49546 RepID=UPI001491A0E7|nr:MULTISPECIES: MarR family transcriptional regulator [Allomuricauda]MDC6366065.1 MarR family transcriptional regulator [Muricauda sp. AC10]
MNVEEIIKTEKEIPLKPRTMIHFALVGNKIREQFALALKPFEISEPQFNVLRILRGQKGKPCNLSTINERMVTKMSNTTRLVDKLIAKEYVERWVCPENRRKVEIMITAGGLEALKEIDHVIQETETDVLKNFSTHELKELNNLLDKF